MSELLIFLCDSRSKVLYSNFKLGVSQPTHLYDFSFSLCGVTQGNPAKHKLGARFAQVFPYTIIIYFNLCANHFRRFLDLANWRVIARSAFCMGQGAVVSEYVNPAGPKLRN